MQHDLSRFEFIGHALHGTGPFRPVVVSNGTAAGVSLSSASALVRYPREGVEKYARRNEVAHYASPLMRACSRFTGYLFSRDAQREFPHQLYEVMAADVNGRGDALDVWFSRFAVDLKARGSMLLLVDMPRDMPGNLAAQIQQRKVPVWTQIAPERLTDFALAEDGKFEFAAFRGQFTRPDASQVPCVWRFDRQGWSATDNDKRVLDSGEHGLGECPILICTEAGDFPSFGPFSAIADLARRLFNLDSELDEILRSQTFSILAMEVPPTATEKDKIAAAKTAGETIGASNLLLHPGSTPSFIAPPDGPARVYMDRIKALQETIDELALDVSGSSQRESGVALQMRFHSLNGELARFAARLEDLERRAWNMTARRLGMQAMPTTRWPRDFNLADVSAELDVLQRMKDSGMPAEVIAEQEIRIVDIQFAGMDEAERQPIIDAIRNRTQEPPRGDNVIPLDQGRSSLNAALVDLVRSANA